MSFATTVPPVSTLPGAPVPTDNGVTICFILIPALVVIPCLLAYLCNVLDLSSSDGKRVLQALVFWVATVFMMVAIGLACVHTAREEMAGYYNDAVRNWQQDGGRAVFQNLSSFYLSPVYNFYEVPSSTSPQVRFSPRAIPVRISGYTEGIPRNVSSVVQELNLSHDLFRNFSGAGFLESLVQGGYEEEHKLFLGSVSSSSDDDSSSSSLYSSDWPPGKASLPYWNHTIHESISCSREFCTSGCQYKKYTWSGSCSVSQVNGSVSKIVRYCQKQGGTFTASRSSSVAKTGVCYKGSSCGTCIYNKILLSTCYCMDRSERRKWSVLKNGEAPCRVGSKLCGGERWSSENAFNKSTMPTSVSVRLMSVEDPGLLLEEMTDGTYTFPISSEKKYNGTPATVVGVFALLFFSLFFILIIWGEEIACCAPDSRVRYFFETGELDLGSDSSDSEAESNPILNAVRGGGSGGYDGASDGSLDQQIVCQICWAAPRNTKFKSCSHHICCNSCAQKIVDSSNKVCPLCRADVKDGFDPCAIDDPTYVAFPREKSEGSLSGGGSSGEFSQKHLCQVCMFNKRNVRFSCGHCCCCDSCGQLVMQQVPATCPLCRVAITTSTPCNSTEQTYRDLNAAPAAQSGGGRRGRRRGNRR